MTQNKGEKNVLFAEWCGRRFVPYFFLHYCLLEFLKGHHFKLIFLVKHWSFHCQLSLDVTWLVKAYLLLLLTWSSFGACLRSGTLPTPTLPNNGSYSQGSVTSTAVCTYAAKSAFSPEIHAWHFLPTGNSVLSCYTYLWMPRINCPGLKTCRRNSRNWLLLFKHSWMDHDTQNYIVILFRFLGFV